MKPWALVLLAGEFLLPRPPPSAGMGWTVLLSPPNMVSAHQRGGCSFAQMVRDVDDMGTGVVAAITLSLTAAAFESWGWRSRSARAPCSSRSLGCVGGVERLRRCRRLESRHAMSKLGNKKNPRPHVVPYSLPSLSCRSRRCVMLFVVFSSPMVRPSCTCPGPLRLRATDGGAACHSSHPLVRVRFLGSHRRRPVYPHHVAAIRWAFEYFRLMDTGHPLLIGVSVAVALRSMRGVMYGPQAAFHHRTIPVAGEVRRARPLAYTLAGVVAGASRR